MTLARVRRPRCAARPAAWKASPNTYTPPWKYRTTWRGSVPATVISATGTVPSAAAVTVTSAGRGTAEVSSRSSRRSSPTPRSAGNADCRRIASRFSRCSVLTVDLLRWDRSAALPSRLVPVDATASPAGGGHCQRFGGQGGEGSPHHGDVRDGGAACVDPFLPAMVIWAEVIHRSAGIR